MSDDTDTHAMMFHEPAEGWFFIPTVPEARKWRGPYRTYAMMENAALAELGADVSINLTTVNGPHK